MAQQTREAECVNEKRCASIDHGVVASASKSTVHQPMKAPFRLHVKRCRDSSRTGVRYLEATLRASALEDSRCFWPPLSETGVAKSAETQRMTIVRAQDHRDRPPPLSLLDISLKLTATGRFMLQELVLEVVHGDMAFDDNLRRAAKRFGARIVEANIKHLGASIGIIAVLPTWDSAMTGHHCIRDAFTQFAVVRVLDAFDMNERRTRCGVNPR